MPQELSLQEKEHYAEVLFNQSYDTLDEDQIEKMVLYYEQENAYIISAMSLPKTF